METPHKEWADTRDVFTVTSARVLTDWELPDTPRARNLRRKVQLRGQWAPGSQSLSVAYALYPRSVPSPELYAARATRNIDHYEDGSLTFTESAPPGSEWHGLPVALTPGNPPTTKGLQKAIQETAAQVAGAPNLPLLPELDVLARREPRVPGGLPTGPDTIRNLVDALSSMSDSYVAVQGPPGTGKTYTGARVIRRLAEERGWKVGVVAQSHAVVENMLSGVIAAGLPVDRVGKRAKDDAVPNTHPWRELSSGEVAHFLAEPGGRVLGGTMWDFVNEGRVARRGLDLLVIDEAGQFSLAGTLAAAVSARRLLLLGDPQQLPQVSQGTHPEPVDRSALEWVMGGAPTIPREYGYFLGETYRLAPDLCGRVSTLSYRDELHPAPPATQRELADTPAGVEVITLPHLGNRTESPEEAHVIVTKIQELLGTTWTDPSRAAQRPLEAADFLVVAPYNAQVELIRKHLDQAGLGDVRVGTVDKFQGQEAPVAFLSMTASTPQDVPRGMEFILNRNRINVAISRAQWLAIIVRSEILTDYLPSSVDGFLDLGGFLGLSGER